MIKNFDLIFSINFPTNNTKLSENLKIFLFPENIMHWRINHFRTKIFNQLIRYEIINNKLIILK